MISKIFSRKSSVLEASGILAIAYLASKVLGVVRDSVLLTRLGAGDITDAYTVAFYIPDFIFGLLILGALSSAFIPIFVEYLNKDGTGAEEAWGLVNTLINFGVILLSIVLVVAAIFAPTLVHLIAPGFEGEKREMVIHLMRVMLFSPLFFGISNLAGGILNSFRNFFAYALAPILYNLGIIFGIIFLYPHFGYMGLAYGVVIGAFLHMLIQVPGVFFLGYKYRFKMNIAHPAFRKMALLMLPRTVGIGVSQMNDIINGAMFASLLGVGSVTIWKVSGDLISVAVGVFGIPFAVAIFPVLAEHYSLKKMSEFASDVVKTTRQILFFILPAMMFYWLLRAQVVRLIYGYGEFGWEETRFTVTVVAFLTFGLVAQALIPLMARAFYALQDTRTPLIISLTTLALNAGLAWALIPQYKLVGLAVALSVATLTNAGLLIGVLTKKIDGFHWESIGVFLVKVIPAALAMGGVGYLFLRVLDLIVDTHTVFGLTLQTVVTTLVMILSYLAICKLLRVAEVGLILRPRKFLGIGR